MYIHNAHLLEEAVEVNVDHVSRVRVEQDILAMAVAEPALDQHQVPH
jgi:hypothetical protein